MSSFGTFDDITIWCKLSESHQRIFLQKPAFFTIYPPKWNKKEVSFTLLGKDWSIDMDIYRCEKYLYTVFSWTLTLIQLNWFIRKQYLLLIYVYCTVQLVRLMYGILVLLHAWQNYTRKYAVSMEIPFSLIKYRILKTNPDNKL